MESILFISTGDNLCTITNSVLRCICYFHVISMLLICGCNAQNQNPGRRLSQHVLPFRQSLEYFAKVRSEEERLSSVGQIPRSRFRVDKASRVEIFPSYSKYHWVCREGADERMISVVVSFPDGLVREVKFEQLK